MNQLLQNHTSHQNVSFIDSYHTKKEAVVRSTKTSSMVSFLKLARFFTKLVSDDHVIQLQSLHTTYSGRCRFATAEKLHTGGKTQRRGNHTVLSSGAAKFIFHYSNKLLTILGDTHWKDKPMDG